MRPLPLGYLLSLDPDLRAGITILKLLLFIPNVFDSSLQMGELGDLP